MYLRVTKSPEEIPADSPLDDMDIEAVRFVDSRYASTLDLLRETSHELAQYQERCEELERLLAKHEWVKAFEPEPYNHALVRWDE